MGSERDDDSPLEQIAVSVVTGFTLLVAFGLLIADVSFFWVAFPVGFAGLLPLAVGLVRWHEQRTEASVDAAGDHRSETEDALEELRSRYARGELTDEEFERRLGKLLETESVHDARKYADRTRSGDRAPTSDGDEREREHA